MECGKTCTVIFLSLILMTAGFVLTLMGWFAPPLNDFVNNVRTGGPIVLLIGCVLMLLSCLLCAVDQRKCCLLCAGGPRQGRHWGETNANPCAVDDGDSGDFGEVMTDGNEDIDIDKALVISNHNVAGEYLNNYPPQGQQTLPGYFDLDNGKTRPQALHDGTMETMDTMDIDPKSSVGASQKLGNSMDSIQIQSSTVSDRVQKSRSNSNLSGPIPKSRSNNNVYKSLTFESILSEPPNKRPNEIKYSAKTSDPNTPVEKSVKESVKESDSFTRQRNLYTLVQIDQTEKSDLNEPTEKSAKRVVTESDSFTRQRNFYTLVQIDQAELNTSKSTPESEHNLLSFTDVSLPQWSPYDPYGRSSTEQVLDLDTKLTEDMQNSGRRQRQAFWSMDTSLLDLQNALPHNALQDHHQNLGQEAQNSLKDRQNSLQDHEKNSLQDHQNSLQKKHQSWLQGSVRQSSLSEHSSLQCLQNSVQKDPYNSLKNSSTQPSLSEHSSRKYPQNSVQKDPRNPLQRNSDNSLYTSKRQPSMSEQTSLQTTLQKDSRNALQKDFSNPIRNFIQPSLSEHTSLQCLQNSTQKDSQDSLQCSVRQSSSSEHTSLPCRQRGLPKSPSDHLSEKSRISMRHVSEYRAMAGKGVKDLPDYQAIWMERKQLPDYHSISGSGVVKDVKGVKDYPSKSGKDVKDLATAGKEVEEGVKEPDYRAIAGKGQSGRAAKFYTSGGSNSQWELIVETPTDDKSDFLWDYENKGQ